MGVKHSDCSRIRQCLPNPVDFRRNKAGQRLTSRVVENSDSIDTGCAVSLALTGRRGGVTPHGEEAARRVSLRACPSKFIEAGESAQG